MANLHQILKKTSYECAQKLVLRPVVASNYQGVHYQAVYYMGCTTSGYVLSGWKLLSTNNK